MLATSTFPGLNALTAAYPTDGAAHWHPRHARIRLGVDEFGRTLDAPLRPIPPRFAGVRLASGATRGILQDDFGEVMALPGHFPLYVPWLAGLAADAPLDWGRINPAAYDLAFVLLSVQLVQEQAVRALELRFLDDVVARLPDRWALRAADLADWAMINGGPAS